ncbi:hypothetical protein XENTR_v10016684 [Xenopus tropicalis]|nr:hypothetical protein XENTR_v10016684 [Xenopus tropicalis]
MCIPSDKQTTVMGAHISVNVLKWLLLHTKLHVFFLISMYNLNLIFVQLFVFITDEMWLVYNMLSDLNASYYFIYKFLLKLQPQHDQHISCG